MQFSRQGESGLHAGDIGEIIWFTFQEIRPLRLNVVAAGPLEHLL